MNARYPAAIALTFALAACGGGGGGGTAPPVSAPAAPTSAPLATGTVPMTISIPRTSPSSSQRSPQFLSPGVASIAVYDGATLLYVANMQLDSTPQFATVFAKSGATTVAPGSCTFTNTAAVCTATITSTIGAHTFGVTTYGVTQGASSSPLPSVARAPQDVGTPPVFHGIISSEGQFAVTLSPGTNPGQTLTLLGVASQVLRAGLSESGFNTTTTYGYRIQDSTNVQIIQPGNAYDNGPVTITAAPAGIVTISPNSIATPPASAGDQNFGVTCVNSAGGVVTISFNTRTSPNTSYASGLTYSTANYSGATIATFSFTCDAATATIPITVNGKRS